MWKARFDLLFRRNYARLESNVQKRIDMAVAEIMCSEDPATLGRQKRGDLRHYYGYDLGTNYRIIYYVSYSTMRVIFADVGSHKQVLRQKIELHALI